MVERLTERVELARRAGALKRAAGLPLLDPGREAAVVRRAGEMARAAGLDAEGVRDVWWQMVALCRQAQEEGR
jgi:chorismate mutase